MKYTGRAFDTATGLQNNDNRWYEAVTSRWLSQDPIAADDNLYRYCGNNPVIYVDPRGLDIVGMDQFRLAPPGRRCPRTLRQ